MSTKNERINTAAPLSPRPLNALITKVINGQNKPLSLHISGRRGSHDVCAASKIDEETIELEHYDGVITRIPVIKLASRRDALALLKAQTKEALTREDAFERLEVFLPESQYLQLRNEEIEEALERVSGVRGYRIKERCPFNGSSWFSEG